MTVSQFNKAQGTELSAQAVLAEANEHSVTVIVIARLVKGHYKPADAFPVGWLTKLIYKD